MCRADHLTSSWEKQKLFGGSLVAKWLAVLKEDKKEEKKETEKEKEKAKEKEDLPMWAALSFLFVERQLEIPLSVRRMQSWHPMR